MSSSNPRLIAKNTIVLYVRTLITMLIALYTSRVVLQTLGVEDFGLYNVVGGIVTILSVVISGLTSATQRFLSYAMGEGDDTELAHVFGVCFVIHCLFALVILLLGLTIGIWFLNTYIQIPEGRETAAFWIYIISLITVCISLIRIPFSACIISHERMTVFAYIGIFDAVLKLIIAIAIGYVDGDRLIYYGALMGSISIVNLLIYYFICYKSHRESHTLFYWNRSLLKRVFGFTSWNMLGQGAMVCNEQGVSIIINMFYSVVANAANSIASQVNAALKSLTGNFLSAYQPQITKSYASNDFTYVKKLLYGTSKLSFYLVALFAVIIIPNIDIILKVWLGSVPKYTNVFCSILIISSIINSLGNPAKTIIIASGNIKNFQIVTTIIYFTGIIVTYISFKLGALVYFAPLIKLLVDISLTTYRLKLMKGMIPSISYSDIFKNIIYPVAIVACIMFFLAIGLFFVPEGWIRIMLSMFVFVLSFVIVYRVGVTKKERSLILSFIPFIKHAKEY